MKIDNFNNDNINRNKQILIVIANLVLKEAKNH